MPINACISVIQRDDERVEVRRPGVSVETHELTLCQAWDTLHARLRSIQHHPSALYSPWGPPTPWGPPYGVNGPERTVPLWCRGLTPYTLRALGRQDIAPPKWGFNHQGAKDPFPLLLYRSVLVH